MPQIYQYKLTVPDNAVDVNGHVNNIEYLRWMQDAAVFHSDVQGCTKATIAAGATWVVRTHHIKYLRPAFAGEEIVILTWVADFRRVHSLRRYRILRIVDNTVLVEGETDWVFVDAKTGRLRPIPQDVIAAFEVLPKEKESEVISRLNTLENYPDDASRAQGNK